MLDFYLTLASYFGLATLLIVGLFFNRHFFLTLFLVKPFIDMTVNVNIIGEFNALEISGVFSALLLLIKYLNKPISYPTFNEIWIWIFIGLQIFSFFLNVSVDTRSIFISTKVYLKMLNSYLIYFMAAIEMFENFKKRVNLIKVIWLTTLAAGVITILVFALGLSNFDTTRGVVRYNGLYNDPGTPSYLSVICLLFCNLYFSITLKKPNHFFKFLKVLTLGVTGVILVITMTKSALVMFLIYVIMWYGIYEKHMFLIIPALAISIYLSFSLSDDLNTRFETEINYVDSGGDADAAKSIGTGRVNRWETLFDVYFNELGPVNQLFGTSKHWMAHNQYIAYLMQVGIVGLTIFLIFLIRFIVKLFTIYHKTHNPSVFAAYTLLIMYVFYAFTVHPFDYTTLLWYLMILLSMINVYDVHQMRLRHQKIKELNESNLLLKKTQLNINNIR